MVKNVTQVSQRTHSKVGYILTGVAGTAIGLTVGAGVTSVSLNEELKTQQARHTVNLQEKDEVWSQKFRKLQAELRELKNIPPVVALSPDEKSAMDYSTQGFVLDGEWINILVKNEGVHPPKAYEDYFLKLKEIVHKLIEIRGRNKPGSLNLPEIVANNSKMGLKTANQNINALDPIITEGKEQGEDVRHFIEQRQIFNLQKFRHELILELVKQQEEEKK